MNTQSFTNENFIKIFYEENRKGNYIENRFSSEFLAVRRVSNKIVKVNNIIKTKRKEFQRGLITHAKLIEFEGKKEKIKSKLSKKRHENIDLVLKKIEKNVTDKKYDLGLKVGFVKNGKNYYSMVDDTPEAYFVIKQVQSNINKSFKVKQSNRDEILNQLKKLLEDGFPKYVIRTDIKGCFESIPHDKLKEKISKNLSFTQFSKSLINKILRNFSVLTTTTKGIPRGIGVSAGLLEIYMREFDSNIKNIPNVVYYARYVDDIVIVFSPYSKYDKFDEYIKLISGQFALSDLEMNPDKTDFINITENDNYQFDFLGYRFATGPKTFLSQRKKNKYRSKIESAISTYNEESKYDETKARKSLVARFKYLTGNTNLLNVKKDILVGSYFSNKFLDKSNLNCLKGLDHFMHHKVDKFLMPHPNIAHINLPLLKEKLKRFSFVRGFEDKTYHTFTSSDLKMILKIWKDL